DNLRRRESPESRPVGSWSASVEPQRTQRKIYTKRVKPFGFTSNIHSYLLSFSVFSVSSVVKSRLRYRQLTFAQILDPVAQLGRLFKLKSFRVLAHFKLKALDLLRDLLGAVTIDLFQLQRNFEVIGFGRGHQSRFNWFDDRHRRDAVLAI